MSTSIAEPSGPTPTRPARLPGIATLAALAILLSIAGCREASPSDQEATGESTSQASKKEQEHAPNGEWCKGHGLPESHCTKCHPELIAKFKEKGDWCAEHGFPESACPKCNPMTPPGADSDGSEPSDGKKAEHEPNGKWCKGHGLPESHCTKCHPELIAKFKEKGDWCAEHGFPESACPKCNPMTPPGADSEGSGSSKDKKLAVPGVEAGTQIRFRRDDHEETVGIEVTEARETPVGLGLEAPARIEFDANATADVRAAVPGIVREIHVDLGQQVDKGDRLFTLESPSVGELQAKLRGARQRVTAARAELERQKKLREEEISSIRALDEARHEFEAAQSELDSLQSRLSLTGAGDRSVTGRYVLRAPLSGTVARRPAVIGAYATAETSLATVVDTSTMWAMLDVPEGDSASVRVGQPVTIGVDGARRAPKPTDRAEGASGTRGKHAAASDGAFRGEITWIAPEVDPKTRTVRVRAELKNPDGRLRAHQFGQAKIGLAADQNGLVVPKSALQNVGEASVVFVRLNPGVYEPRRVFPGRSAVSSAVTGESRHIVQVRGDLKAGESVVHTGAFILKTELSRGSIGAGCCEVPGE